MKAHHLLLTLGFACLLLPHGSGAAQGVLLDARVLVTLPSPGEPVHVRATFKLQPGAGAEEIPLSALSPEPANIGALRALLNEDPAEPSWEGASSPSAGGASPFSLEEVRDHFSEGSFRLAAPASGFGGPLFLHLSYTVERAWTGENRVTLPLVVSRWVPAEPTPRTFLAEVEIPRGYSIVGSFPTSTLHRPEPGMGGNYQLGLQGVPSLLILRVVPGRGSFFTLERGLDLFAVLILLVMGAFGVRYLRSRES